MTNQTLGMRPGSEGLHVLHARREESRIHDEIGLRHYYGEWSRRLGRSASYPYAESPRSLSALPQENASPRVGAAE